jgi:type IV secretory pathway VirJ component
MKRILLMIVLLALVVMQAAPAGSEELDMNFGRFGKLTIYRNSDQPSQVVLFVSGDGGWNLGVVDMARALSDLDAVVVGIDIAAYFHNLKNSGEDCVYSAAEFESLSKFIQRKLGLSQYRIPVLVGYSSGASLVYAVMVQAPYNTFKGAISLGFCPSLAMKPALCQSNGLKWQASPKGEMVFAPFSGLSKPWIAIQGNDDQVCGPVATGDFVKQANNARLISLPHVGHGFSVPKNWLPQFQEAFGEITSGESETPAQNEVLSDLPLVEVSARQPGRNCLAILLTGDGGWAGLDQEVSKGLAENGVPVIGLSTLKYFWTSRTPESASKDLARILRHYLELWKKDRAVLIGYSFGAEVLPFMASRLPKELLAQTTLIVLLGPGDKANFEFHLSDWLGGPEDKGLPTLPEIQKLTGTHLLCLYGNEETDCICPQISQAEARAKAFPGAHHFDGDYKAIVDAILSGLDGQKE